LDEDAVISIADDLAGEMAYAFAIKEDQCGFIGDGTSTYGGIIGVAVKILNAANTAGAVDCATAGHDTFAEVDNGDLAALMGKLPIYARANAKFYCSGVASSLVFGRLKATAGGNTVQNLEGAPGMTYLGRPIVETQVLATSTGDLNNAVMLLYGDLSKAATMGERRGISIARSDQRYFENDLIGLRATQRVDIVVHDLGDTSTAGPVVALIGFTS
jgi:HK97 family phage major capsid protein